MTLAPAAPKTRAPGLYPDIREAEYLAMEAIGSTHLEWLAISPRHYRYMVEHPARETSAMGLGTALHMAVLEPDAFVNTYVLEPDPSAIAPGNEKPRATKAFKEAVKLLSAGGRVVLKQDDMDRVMNMAAAIMAHPVAKRVLEKSLLRELTIVWEQNGRLCRGRADALGANFIADIKTTRDLKRFSPWTITEFGLHRQAAHYENGLGILDRTIEAFYHIAVENEPPHDVGVFVLEDSARVCGHNDCERLLARLAVCEASGTWPGMFPDLAAGHITDWAAQESSAEEGAE